MNIKRLAILLVLSTCVLAQDKHHPQKPGPESFRVVLNNPRSWRHYRVETASTLRGEDTKWKTVFRGHDGANPVTFVDRHTQNYPRKFYRLVREDNKHCDKSKD